jgi:multidrug resistance efflux pump
VAQHQTLDKEVATLRDEVAKLQAELVKERAAAASADGARSNFKQRNKIWQRDFMGESRNNRGMAAFESVFEETRFIHADQELVITNSGPKSKHCGEDDPRLERMRSLSLVNDAEG